MQNKLILACIVMLDISIIALSVAIIKVDRKPDFATLIVKMSDTCHRAPSSTDCQSLIHQVQQGNQWQVYSSNSIYWAEYQS